MVVVVLLFWLACGMIAGTIHGKRGRSEFTGFLVGLLLGPLGIVLAWVAKPDQAGIDNKALADGQMKKCHQCAELVRAEANVCRFCGSSTTMAARKRSV